MQSKCGIGKGETDYYDFSKEHILEAAEGILNRLGTEYLDFLVLHRPDTLMEPEEVAAAFEKLHQDGKVRHFGVSNQNAMQIELLQKYVPFKLGSQSDAAQCCTVSNDRHRISGKYEHWTVRRTNGFHSGIFPFA